MWRDDELARAGRLCFGRLAYCRRSIMSKSVIELVAVIEKLVDEAIDRKLPNVHEVVARLSEELSRQRGTDAEVFAQLVASGNVFLKIKTAAAIADCHDKSI